MDTEKNESQRDDDQVPLPSEEQQIIRQPAAVDHTQVVYLPDANLGESVTESAVQCNKIEVTDSDTIQGDKIDSKYVSLEVVCEPSTSRNCKANTQTLHDASAPKDPCPSSDSAGKEDKSNGTHTETERLQNILDLLHRFSYNLDAIEERLTEDARSAVILQVPQQYCELGTQTGELTTPRRLRVDLTTRRTNSTRHQPDSRPPCERSYHTITIAGNNLPPRQVVQRQTFWGRICRSLGDFLAAFCLCLQVNKDCVFCLGFFVAFVVSVSFLTAFFYRTLNFKSSMSRVPVIPVTGNPQYELTPLRFSGSYYYIYNKNPRNLS
ncbi:hypothetical protein KR032_002836 [Drosophila birchii]|nr:hypothetical protein KR032_002836 [Drosophila birchii]